jgi:hypothetical protein
MKTAIYIEDGTVQLVITPESDFEKNALSTLQEKLLEAKIFSGSFYDCRGGWVRQAQHRPETNFIRPSQNTEDKSLILRVTDNNKHTLAP